MGHLGIAPTVTYKAKIKLDGTNGAIRFENGEVFFQSRTKDVTPKDDNFGFARMMKATRPWMDGMSDPHYYGLLESGRQISDMIVYGEWAGPSVSDTTAVGKLAVERFFVFAVEKDGKLLTEKADIVALDMFEPKFIIPFEEREITIDFSSPEALVEAAAQINMWISHIEEEDPFIKETFNVSGIGEGLVFYAQGDVPEEIRMFKAKGLLHRVTAAKEPVQVKADVLNVDKFVTYFVTEARCKQGLAATGGVKDKKKTGDFMRWMLTDIKKESENELDSNNLNWIDVLGKLQIVIKDWWLK